MKIGIDVTPILYEGTGVGEYTRNLLKELLRQNPDDEFVLFFSTLRGWGKMKEKVKKLAEGSHCRIIGFPLPPAVWQLFWNKLNLIKIDWLIGKTDVFHCWDYLIPPSSCPRIVTIHDVTPILYPDTHTKTVADNYKLVINKIKQEKIPVLTVSENSKKDLIKYAGLGGDKINVVYNGKDETPTKVDDQKNILGRYILVVGTREPRKNLKKATEAFAAIAEKYPELQLVIVGKYGWGKDKFQIKDKVKILGYIKRADLINLYHHAICLVYPSLYEGFGLPVLEAMQFGCPVITSNTSSLPEVGGDAVIYVDPKNTEDIKNSMIRIIESNKLRQELIAKGLAQAKKFSWEKCARETREVYEKIKKLVIGINADEANVAHPVGIGQFALNVICELEKIDTENEYFLYLTSSKKNVLPKERKGWNYKYVWPKKFSTQLALPFNLLLNREHLDVFFTPTHYAPRGCPMPSVVAIMDTSYLMYPQYFARHDLWQLKNWTDYSVRHAKKVAVISESTKKDVVKFYGKKPENVTVCYPGYKTNFSTAVGPYDREMVKKKYHISGEYIIAIGTLQPRKNYERLVRVFARLKKQGRQEKLVIVGKHGWLYDSLFREMKKIGMAEEVIFTGYVPDTEEIALLKGAKAYVLASLYEGFGIPVLEAQACGVPVAASCTSSIPEVAGDAAVYFNPQSEEDMFEKISQLLAAPDLQEKMRQKGLQNVKRFSWEMCAQQVLKTIKEAV